MYLTYYITHSMYTYTAIGIDLFFIFSKGTKNFTHFQEEVYDPKWVSVITVV